MEKTLVLKDTLNDEFDEDSSDDSYEESDEDSNSITKPVNVINNISSSFVINFGSEEESQKTIDKKKWKFVLYI